MSTLTAQIKLRRDTQANWTASNPTLAAGEIAISSDQLHSGTDQPKFKIGDGVQTWTNLDYYPIGGAGVTPTLAQVLAQDNDTNGLSIVSPDGNSAVAIVNGSITESVAVGVNTSNVYQDGASVLMSHLGAVESGNVTVDSTQVDNTHSLKVRLNAPAIELTQETASRVAIIDASKNIKSADTATYPSLTELSYVKGVNSAIQTQINGKEATITTLPISKGGTNSGTALNNGRVMISSAGAIIEGDTATYPSVTELAYLKGVTSALQTQLNALAGARNRLMLAYQNTNSTHTGSTAETILANLSIPANSLGANDRLMIEAQMFNSGTAGTKTFRVYLNTSSNTLVGAVQIATSQLSATNISSGLRRVLVNKNSQSTNEVFPVGANAQSDISSTTVAATTINANFAVQQYLIVSVQLANSGDTGVLSNIQLFVDKAS